MADCGDCAGGGDCGDYGDCGDCGDCGNCDCCVGCGDASCTFLGDAFCCDTTSASISVDPASLGTPLGGADLIPASIGFGPIDTDVIPASTGLGHVSSGIIRDAPGPVSMNIYPVVDYYPVYTSTQQVHGLGYRQENIRFKPPKKRRECCGFALKTWFSFILVLLIIAAIPFGSNCGNTHRGLMGVLVAIVLVGMCLPFYYHYLEGDLVKKEHTRQKKIAADLEKGMPTTEAPNFFYYYDENTKHKNKLKKKSVMASNRFLIALSITGFILQVIVVLGCYYLWSDQNHCTDSRLWIVKGWFIVLLVVTLGVIMWMIGAMFRARKERDILKLANEARINGPQKKDPLLITQNEGMPFGDQKSEGIEDLPAKPITAPSAPSPQPNSTQLLEIKENLNEQQQQQQQQQTAAQVLTNMGPSGTGTYC
ncbi:hypothetical protein BG006_005305 [Podila minutissima]|uniref:Uncharacterized protein n=1 Tax=Podila minutissima TaxID=64525 RepID=A0A9P5VRI9_9FUNG|nr:hypothetical protein BG006_005305 [Podila minutissima]